MPPLIPPAARTPIIPPGMLRVWGRLDAQGNLILSTQALQFLQQLWASLQGQGGVFDIIGGGVSPPPSPGSGAVPSTPPSGAAANEPGPDQYVPLDGFVQALSDIADLAAVVAANRIDLSALTQSIEEALVPKPPDGAPGNVDVLYLENGVRVLTGSGSPETVVYGSVGDLYLDVAGGAGTTLYVKESGAATNTGWIGK